LFVFKSLTAFLFRALAACAIPTRKSRIPAERPFDKLRAGLRGRFAAAEARSLWGKAGHSGLGFDDSESYVKFLQKESYFYIF
jgi:hypothetical protein